MDWHLFAAIAGALFGGLAALGSALNGWQNKSIQLDVAGLRKELVEEKIVPLSDRLLVLETKVEPVLKQCPLLHATAQPR